MIKCNYCGEDITVHNPSCVHYPKNKIGEDSYIHNNSEAKKQGIELLKDSPGLNDPVEHPKHYTFSKFEVIDVLMDWFRDEPLLWQVGKYIARAKHKGKELEDLKKARFYLNKKIEMLESE